MEETLPQKQLQMYIPEIGDKIKLAENWAFALYPESRNANFLKTLTKFNPGLTNFEHVTVKPYGCPWGWDFLQELKTTLVKVPTVRWNSKRFVNSQKDEKRFIEAFKIPLMKGDILQIDRIYVRKGKEDFSSITFKLIDTSNPLILSQKRKSRKTLGRFWAKLSDVNEIKFEKIDD